MDAGIGSTYIYLDLINKTIELQKSQNPG